VPLGAVIAIALGFVAAGLLSATLDISPMLIAIVMMGAFTVCLEFYIRSNGG
jgi:uncharacterized membrane-anchored protein